MPVDIEMLSTIVVSSFLAPYVKLGVETIAKEVSRTIDDISAKYITTITKNIWERVKSAFTSEKEKSVLELFEEDPEKMKDMMIKTLKEKLEKDPKIAQELSELINQPGPDGMSTGAQIVNSGIAGILDARDANFSGSSGMNLAGVMIGNPSTQSTDPLSE